jgi:glutaredoxin 3
MAQAEHAERGVIIYTVTGCPFCARAKQWLDSKGISYEDRDAAVNPKWIDEVVRLTGHGAVPVTVVGKTMIVGFDEPKLEAALGGHSK